MSAHEIKNKTKTKPILSEFCVHLSVSSEYIACGFDGKSGKEMVSVKTSQTGCKMTNGFCCLPSIIIPNIRMAMGGSKYCIYVADSIVYIVKRAI